MTTDHEKGQRRTFVVAVVTPRERPDLPATLERTLREQFPGLQCQVVPLPDELRLSCEVSGGILHTIKTDAPEVLRFDVSLVDEDSLETGDAEDRRNYEYFAEQSAKLPREIY